MNVYRFELYPDPVSLCARLSAAPDVLVCNDTDSLVPVYYIYNKRALEPFWERDGVFLIPPEHPSFPYGRDVLPD